MRSDEDGERESEREREREREREGTETKEKSGRLKERKARGKSLFSAETLTVCGSVCLSEVEDDAPARIHMAQNESKTESG